MITPSPNFRPDPHRAIFIDGVIDDELLSRLTPEILRFHQQSRLPITLYIVSSPGGNTAVMQNLLRLLKMKTQDGEEPGQLITVVTTKAQSAAADLLSAGDYAIAYPDSTLLYHGVRTPDIIPALQPFTAQSTSLLAHLLRLTNDIFAMELAKKTEARFRLRYLFLRNGFQQYRESTGHKSLSDLDCFTILLSRLLSEKAQKVLKKAQDRYKRYLPLIDKLITRAPKAGGPQTQAKIEAARIKAIVTFEVNENEHDPQWTFRNTGITRIVEDFYLIAEYLESQDSQRLREWCLSLGKFTLTKEENDELAKIEDEETRNQKLIEKVQPPVQPLISFFLALCHALQEDDNTITATDAYWLGLVDEIMGDNSLLTLRWFVEYTPDAPAKQEKDEKEKSTEEKTGSGPAGT